ncbi:MAG: type I-C CRISPR-associated protein Cas8c/Csd1, partial [Christensenellaceae bacterium]|nr:type I-C CRISPR-associated protein Cas8c/Csd1 [Christensenellaceae bacterium]
MILQALTEHYKALRRRDLAPGFGWSSRRVSFALQLSPEGELLGLTPLVNAVQQGKKMVELPQTMQVPEPAVRSGVTPVSNFLFDNGSYILGFDEKGKPGRSIECFEACKALHLRLLEGVENPMAAAIRGYFEKWDPRLAREHPALSGRLAEFKSANFIFSLNGDWAQEDEVLRGVWDKAYALRGEGETALCPVTGEASLPLE